MSLPSEQPELSEKAAAPSPSAELAALRQEVALLRTLLMLGLTALAVFAFGISLYIYPQMVVARRQLEENRRVLSNYDRVSKPLMTDFLSKLQSYAATNADFQPILKRYLPAEQPVATSAPAAAPKAPAR